MDAIRMLVSETLRIDYSLVEDALSFQSIPEWNSLGHVELMLGIEKRFGIDIRTETAAKLTSIAAIRTYLASSARPESSTPSTAPSSSASGASGDAPSQVKVARGLDGIVVDNTAISHIDGERGRLSYRGYSIHDLAAYASYEETAYLLLHGELPTQNQLKGFSAELAAGRVLPLPVVTFVRGLSAAHPMDALRSTASLLAAYDPERDDNSPAATYRKGLRLVSQLATALAEHRRARLKLPSAPVDTSEPHVKGFLHAFCDRALDDEAIHIVERNFILHADHSSNASAFAARIATGTHADMHAAFTAAIATFSGALHGGAIEQVVRVVQDIGMPERAEAYVQSQRARGEAVMGFGHRIYRTEDPRARHMRDAARIMAERSGGRQVYDVLEAMRAAMKPLAKHGVNVNVDFYAGIIYHMLGIEPEYFPALFVLGRTTGWLAHIIEQRQANVLIRPRLHYVGPQARPWVPHHQRTAAPADL